MRNVLALSALVALVATPILASEEDDLTSLSYISYLERYATVFHLTSTVEGMLHDRYTAVDCLRACFPGGSITGAPKVRAMEIIDELEPTCRGVYTGAIGYLCFSGDMDLNIVIRTFVVKDGVAHFQVGGGIVAVDLMEDTDGRLLVNEVNNTPEFHGAMESTDVDIAGKMVDYVLRMSEEANQRM